jgi:hypothetical protein
MQRMPRPVRHRVAPAIAALAVAVAACSAPPHGSADPTPQQPPFPIGQLGAPVHAKAASGATADVTLNSAKWFPAGCAGGWECNVIELTITGTSATPFKYEDIYVVWSYEPFTQPNNNNWLGADFNVNYVKINQMPPLRTGSVTNGQTAHGFIGYGCNMCQGDLYIKMIDPDTEHPLDRGPFGVVEAGWKIHT